MKVILGLGNPGLRYKLSRHNLGALVVEKLARIKKIRLNQKAFNCLLGKGKIENQPLLLGLPLTFMNLSGTAAAAIVRRSKIELSDLLVVCDDVNLPLGKLRLRPNGSSGGHKGLTSIIEALGSQDFPRLKIGVGRPRASTTDAALTGHVLGRFNKRETKVVNQAIGQAVQACCLWSEEGIAQAMNKFNALEVKLKDV